MSNYYYYLFFISFLNCKLHYFCVPHCALCLYTAILYGLTVHLHYNGAAYKHLCTLSKLQGIKQRDRLCACNKWRKWRGPRDKRTRRDARTLPLLLLLRCAVVIPAALSRRRALSNSLCLSLIIRIRRKWRAQCAARDVCCCCCCCLSGSSVGCPRPPSHSHFCSRAAVNCVLYLSLSVARSLSHSHAKFNKSALMKHTWPIYLSFLAAMQTNFINWTCWGTCYKRHNYVCVHCMCVCVCVYYVLIVATFIISNVTILSLSRTLSLSYNLYSSLSLSFALCLFMFFRVHFSSSLSMPYSAWF